MRHGPAILMGLALALSSAGCRSCAVVESQLAAREKDVRTLKDRVEKLEFMNHALSAELSATKGLPGPDGVMRAPTEPYPVRSLVLGDRTSARPSDALPGDDALEVQIQPLDTERQPLKAPGSARIVALEVNENGNKRVLSMWDVPAEELRNSWQAGLFTTGYVLTFKFKEFPSTEKLRIAVAFRMQDGRVLEADKDIAVRVVPLDKRPRLVPGPFVAPPLPPLPGTEKELPPPTPVPVPPAKELPKPKEAPPPMEPAPEGPTLTGGKKPAATLLKPVPLVE
ncbi:MAG: hypothetical protein K2W96_20800 [Gemmataceae bacterium]|nr:hypothetical protein [Gemmataceae bacterium]